jgi:hypothetical protein
MVKNAIKTGNIGGENHKRATKTTEITGIDRKVTTIG